MAHVLVATLGDSPIVVTSMYDLLTEQEKLPIEKVIVLYPKGDSRDNGYLLIGEALQGKCPVEPRELICEDAYTEEDCFHFLQKLFEVMNEHRHDRVHLSLAGGRKNMSAIMALVAPFYAQHIEGLYHVIDRREDASNENFKTLQELQDLYGNDTTRWMQAMHPDLNDQNIRLVCIPFDKSLSVSALYLQKLSTMTAGQLQKLWEKDPTEAERQQFIIQLVNPGIIDPLLQVYLTEQAKEEFEELGDNLAQDFVLCFENMRYPRLLDQNKHGPLPDKKKNKPYPCYVYKRGRTAERPFFHTEPEDIAYYTQRKVEWVIVERLAKHKDDVEYIPSVEQLMRTKYKNGDKLYPLNDVLKNTRARKLAAEQSTPSILIVPMGMVPMVATQLYTLLQEREHREIREIILLYPGKAEQVRHAVKMAKEAFENEAYTNEKMKHIQFICTPKPIAGLDDIASTENCETYQKELEKVIQDARRQHPDWRIDLALSGGRKGMAAMALFAAQRAGLREVYHTLIADSDLDREIMFATDDDRLKKRTPKERNDLLFLRAYKGRKDKFRLFKVPMGPLRGK